jgi:hypothetical protein
MYMCYDVNLVPTFKRHTCNVPDTHGIASGSNTYTFLAADCSNGLPSGDCDGTISKQLQCGYDEGVCVCVCVHVWMWM